jgi:hypothetical protein
MRIYTHIHLLNAAAIRVYMHVYGRACVCVCVCVCIYIYIYIYICIPVHMQFTYAHSYLNAEKLTMFATCVAPWMCLHAGKWKGCLTNPCVCVCVYLYVYVCVSVEIHTCVHDLWQQVERLFERSLHAHIYMCMSMCPYIIYMHTHARAYPLAETRKLYLTKFLCMCICTAYMYLCMYDCTRMHTHREK